VAVEISTIGARDHHHHRKAAVVPLGSKPMLLWTRGCWLQPVTQSCAAAAVALNASPMPPTLHFGSDSLHGQIPGANNLKCKNWHAYTVFQLYFWRC